MVYFSLLSWNLEIGSNWHWNFLVNNVMILLGFPFGQCHMDICSWKVDFTWYIDFSLAYCFPILQELLILKKRRNIESVSRYVEYVTSWVSLLKVKFPYEKENRTLKSKIITPIYSWAIQGLEGLSNLLKSILLKSEFIFRLRSNSSKNPIS